MENTQVPKNAISWFEISATDITRAKSFYEKVFDTKLHEMSLPTGLKMALFPVESGGVGGAISEHAEFYHPSHQGSLVYLNANPDLQEKLDRVEGAGGKVIMPKTQISEEHGFMALFEDSEGNRVAFHSDK